MTKEEAMEIIKLNHFWNVSQKGNSKSENDLHEARRAALKKAWKTLGEEPDTAEG